MGRKQKGTGSDAHPDPSSSRAAPKSRPGGSSPPSSPRPLTPYQARFDVEMDDTAVSKVRDPSVSFRVSGRPARAGFLRPGPVASLVLGIAGGVALVIALVLAFRGCGG